MDERARCGGWIGVRQRWTACAGSIEVASTQGLGTPVTLRLPLTLAIIERPAGEDREAFFVLPLQYLECSSS